MGAPDYYLLNTDNKDLIIANSSLVKENVKTNMKMSSSLKDL
jgi:hypothetical protein